MNRPNPALMGVATLLLAIFIFLIALGLLPSAEVARGKGTFYPLVYTWLMVGTVELSALRLAWFLFTGTKQAHD